MAATFNEYPRTFNDEVLSKRIFEPIDDDRIVAVEAFVCQSAARALPTDSSMQSSVEAGAPGRIPPIARESRMSP